MGGFIRFLAIAVWVISGVAGLIMGLQLITDMWGTFWTVICFFACPIPIYISPWIAIFRDGDWTLFLISYGGTAVYIILNLISSQFSNEK